jgi:hypothetical protein
MPLPLLPRSDVFSAHQSSSFSPHSASSSFFDRKNFIEENNCRKEALAAVTIVPPKEEKKKKKKSVTFAEELEDRVIFTKTSETLFLSRHYQLRRQFQPLSPLHSPSSSYSPSTLQMVKLQSAISNSLKISGTIAIENVCWRKEVFVRWSFDNWWTFRDTQAVFLKSSSKNESENGSRGSDVFSYEIELPEPLNRTLESGRQLSFVVAFKPLDAPWNEEIFWDNNRGLNYKFECRIQNWNQDLGCWMDWSKKINF